MPVMPRRVENGGDNHNVFRFDHLVNNAVGKASRVAPTNVPAGMLPAVQKRVVRQRVENLNHRLAEFTAKPFLPDFVPLGGLGDVTLRIRADHHAPAHDSVRRRRFISSNGTEDLGSARWAASLDSTSASSSSESARSSSSSSL